ncbi:malto-oligosyltrehalose trehalohydrolase [Loktanella sp. R86503]|uniref:malto-oligosyltrehalose trehalohydrolase n=1 Tax=Loktanella sp. R86503 TaxID=3093847 RepID=UPI0036D9F599
MGKEAAQWWGVRQDQPGQWSAAIWAPDAQRVSVVVLDQPTPLSRESDGTFRGHFSAKVGATYMFDIDGTRIPDPAARQQSRDVHGPSCLTVLPPTADTWPGRDWRDAVVSEIHIGTFTKEGTFAAAAAQLPRLARLGINTVEVMPIAQFAGQRGWGYDGVLHYAVHPAYGTPGDFADFVAAAHRLDMSVILDVVYNHFGPEGAYLHTSSPAFFDAGRVTPWGPAIDFTQNPVRAFFIENAIMWVRDFGVDGLRLDAVHQIQDPTTPEFLAELSTSLRALNLPRPLHLIAEDERNLPDHRQSGVTDAQWNDDYHHSLHCLLTGETEGYYAPFAIDPVRDLATALTEGHVDQGQLRPGQDPTGKPRGAPSGHLPPQSFVNASQTHDQIGNRALGERLIALSSPDAMRIAHAMLLTSPFVPMLFQGEEIGARTPFPFFCDFSGDLAAAVRKGRLSEFSAFSGFDGTLPDPLDPQTFHDARPYDAPPADAAAWEDLTTRLLTWRRAVVLPLLHGGLTSASARILGPKALHVLWHFNTGKLNSVIQLGQPVPADNWPESQTQLSLGSHQNDFAFHTWIEQT